MREPSRRSFRIWYNIVAAIAYVAVCLVHRPRFTGKEHLPQGPAVLCSNHTKWYDPILVGRAYWPGRPIRYMAKAELFKNPIISFFLYHIGMFPVARGTADMSALKQAVHFLEEGDAVLIFPEGTRTKTNGEVRPKGGAVKIAQWADVPVVPIYIPKERSIRKRVPVVIGEPFRIDSEAKDHQEQAHILMDRIYALREEI